MYRGIRCGIQVESALTVRGRHGRLQRADRNHDIADRPLVSISPVLSAVQPCT